MATPLLLSALAATGLAGFAVVLVAVVRLRLMISSASLQHALNGFAFLASSQALYLVSYISPSEALAYAYHVGGSASSVMGYVSLAAAAGLLGSGGPARAREAWGVQASIVGILVLPATLEVMAALLALAAARPSQRVLRWALAALAFSHAAKAAALLAGEAGLQAFLAAEAVRATTASALALYYAGSVLRP